MSKINLSNLLDTESTNPNTNNFHLVRAQDVAAVLGVTDIYVRMLARECKIPCYKLGTRFWFSLPEIYEHKKK